MSERTLLLRTRGHRGGEEGRLQRRPGVVQRQVCVIGGLTGARYTTYYHSFAIDVLLILLLLF
jgi:hypothetical protein